MSSVPRPSKIELDSSGNSHLICVENDATDIVQARLEASEFITQNIKILQLGGIKVPDQRSQQAPSFHGGVICDLEPNIERFDLMANLRSRLTEICDRAYMGMRFYAIGSEQFVWHLRGYARSFGLAEEEINLEVVARESRNIYCSNCQLINSLVSNNIFICSGCGIKLEVLDHFSRLKNAYLGISADAESLEEPSKIK